MKDSVLDFLVLKCLLNITMETLNRHLNTYINQSSEKRTRVRNEIRSLYMEFKTMRLTRPPREQV